jgi:hypothetical protein
VDLTNSWAKRNLLLCSQRWSGLSEAAAALAARLKAHGTFAATPRRRRRQGRIDADGPGSSGAMSDEILLNAD